MKCNNCGSDIDVSANFCNICGAKNINSSYNQNQYPQYTNTSYQTTQTQQGNYYTYNTTQYNYPNQTQNMYVQPQYNIPSNPLSEDEQKLKEHREAFKSISFILFVLTSIFILPIFFHDIFDRISISHDCEVTATLINFDYDEYVGRRTVTTKYYSIYEDEDGDIIRLRQTYGDEIGREIQIYKEKKPFHGTQVDGVRKKYEIRVLDLKDKIMSFATALIFIVWIYFLISIHNLKKKNI